jgi:hypothetical protein
MQVFESLDEEKTIVRLHDRDMSEQVLRLDIPDLVDIVAWRGDQDHHLQLCARQLNAFMRNEYKGFIYNTGRNIYPLIIASDFEPGFEGVGSSFTLFLKDGRFLFCIITMLYLFSLLTNKSYDLKKVLNHSLIINFIY